VAHTSDKLIKAKLMNSSLMESAGGYASMETPMKVSGSMVRSMVMAGKYTMKVNIMKDNGLMTSHMAKANT
jgi:hypothetical protein